MTASNRTYVWRCPLSQIRLICTVWGTDSSSDCRSLAVIILTDLFQLVGFHCLQVWSNVSGLCPAYARAQNTFLKRWHSQGKFCYPQWYANHESEDWQIQLSMDSEPQGQPAIFETLNIFIFGRNKSKGYFQSMGTKIGTQIWREIRQTSLNESPLSHSRTIRSPFFIKTNLFTFCINSSHGWVF